MGKFVLIVIAVYILYYAGIIIYDLFIKKDSVKDDDSVETELAFQDLSEEIEENVKSVNIDDVEEINAPSSFNSEEFVSDFNDVSFDEQSNEESLKRLEAKYKVEKELQDRNDENNNISENSSDEEKVEETPINSNSDNSDEKETEKENEGGAKQKKLLQLQQDFERLLSESKSSIKVVGSIKDVKIYNISA